MSACAQLLMSSEVHAKCTNSKTRSSSFEPDWTSFSLMTYSTAFTSWFVVRSTFFTKAASSTVNCVAIFSRTSLASGEKGVTSTTCGIRERHCSQRISTRTRALMSPYSEREERRGATLGA